MADAQCPERRQQAERRNEPDGNDAGREETTSRAAQCSGGVWLLTAGVPCQPASRAGKQRGAADDRWLWPEAIRVIAAVQPTWALLENPPGIGDVGLHGVLSALEAQGYEVRVLSIPACAVNAPHRRERFWIVCKRLANASETQRERPDAEPGTDGLHPEHPESELADAGGERCRARRAEPAGQQRQGEVAEPSWSNYVWTACADSKLRRSPAVPQQLANGLRLGVSEALGTPWAAEAKDRPHRSLLGALGNSIVPQVAQVIIQAMIQSEECPE